LGRKGNNLPKIYFEALLSSTEFHIRNKKRRKKMKKEMNSLFQEHFWKPFASGTMGPMSYHC